MSSRYNASTLARVILSIAYLLVWSDSATAVEIRVEGDVDDSLVQSPNFSLRGNVDPPGLGIPQIRIGNQSFPATSTHDRWEAQVSLMDGLNIVEVSYGGISRFVAITLARGLNARPQQNVRIVWDTDADNQLRLIARETLRTPPGAA